MNLIFQKNARSGSKNESYQKKKTSIDDIIQQSELRNRAEKTKINFVEPAIKKVSWRKRRKEFDEESYFSKFGVNMFQEKRPDQDPRMVRMRKKGLSMI